MKTATGGTTKLVKYRPATGFSINTAKPYKDTLGISRAEQVEVEGVVRPRAPRYVDILAAPPPVDHRQPSYVNKLH